MNRAITHTETLVYYDGPQVFVAVDQVGTRYLSVLVEEGELFNRYLCVPVSERRLAAFVGGWVDLRSIYAEPETNEHFTCDIASFDLPVAIVALRKPISEDWLPDPGFTLDKTTMLTAQAVESSVERNRSVFHLSLSPPEARDALQIDNGRLIAALSIVQGLIRFAYGNALKTIRNEDRRRYYRQQQFWSTQIYGIAHGSFTLRMQAAAEADLFGYSPLMRAFERIDELSAPDVSDDELVLRFSRNRGHLLNFYSRLIDFVVTNETPVSYAWATPVNARSGERSIAIDTAFRAKSVLELHRDLSTVFRTFTGRVTHANTTSGKWTLRTDAGNLVSGRMPLAYGPSLGGIVLVNKRYRFVCEERVATFQTTGVQKVELFLVKKSELPDEPKRETETVDPGS